MNLTRTRYQHGSLTTETRKTGPSVWVYRWRETGASGERTKRKQILGTVKELSKTQAQRKADSLKERANTPTSVADKHLTVSALAEHYMQHELSDSSTKTLKVRKAYLHVLANYILPRWGKMKLGAVKAVEVETWLKSLCKANGTKAKLREVFGATFRHAMRHDLFHANPITNVRQARKRASQPSTLEPSEVVAVLEHLEGIEPVRTAFLIVAVTGMRRGELFGLKWQDVDFGKSEVHIRRSIVDGVEGPPKTESSRRPLPIPKQMLTALEEWKRESLYSSNADWVFASDHSFGKQPLWPGTLWRRNIGSALERAGIVKTLGWHSLRRSYASMLMTTGANLRVSMELMRRSTADMTLATYAQSVGDDKRDAGRKVADFVLGQSKAA